LDHIAISTWIGRVDFAAIRFFVLTRIKIFWRREEPQRFRYIVLDTGHDVVHTESCGLRGWSHIVGEAIVDRAFLGAEVRSGSLDEPESDV
jgi:hypothetical protein